MNMELEPKNLSSKATFSDISNIKNVRRMGTLRRRLLVSVLPTVLLPLAIASAIGYRITENRATKQALSQLEETVLLTSSTVTAFIRDSFKIPDLVASNSLVIEAMRAGARESQAQNLPQQPIESLEQKFSATKLLKVDSNLNNYLKQVVESSDIVEIFFTEKNGFNVAFSNPTSDFVQRDESWWQTSKNEGKAIDEPEFDESANATVFALSEAVIDPQTKEFLGVIKAGIPVEVLNSNLAAYLSSGIYQSQTVQVVDSQAGSIMSTINARGSDSKIQEIIGGEAILQIANSINSFLDGQSAEEIRLLLKQNSAFSNVMVKQKEIFSQNSILVQLKYRDKIYDFATIPNTNLVVIASVNASEIAAAGQNLITVFALTGIILGIVAVGLVVLLARQLSQPLTNLSAKTQQATIGNLDVRANLEGTLETKTLASNFNQLVSQVKNLIQEQKDLANEQRHEKEQLETAIYTLIDEISDATDGDLTVRANLDSMELSTVADLFNAIIDNLQEIAIEAKDSTSLVGDSLRQNESAIRSLAEQAVKEARETRDTLISVEQMSQSIQVVAQNADRVEQIVDDTYHTVVSSTEDMDSTEESILTLRQTINETTRKMKRLQESSQKISQATALIEEIALKTNVLAINAGAEADRVGEYGQGFAIVAEQVGSLAKQSNATIKEIARTVASIQAETQEVNEAMISGTTQVAKTTHLVKSTKQSLGLVLEKSREVNQLIASISQSTVSQADTSQNVTNLMQKIAQLSENTSKSSQEVARSIVETAQVAAKLQSTVAQFKVTE